MKKAALGIVTLAEDGSFLLSQGLRQSSDPLPGRLLPINVKA